MSWSSRLRSLFSDTGEDVSVFLPHVTGLVHVGANRADERDLYAGLGLHVLWVEALPEVFVDLQRHIATTPRQIALQALVTDRDGQEHTFNVSSNAGLSSSIFTFGDHSKLWSDIEMVRTVQLTSTRLDTLLQRHAIDVGAYQALLLDTQGSELLVLQGAGDLLERFEFIQAEAADFNAYQGACQLRDLDAFLRTQGFRRVLKVPMAGRAEIGHYYDVLYVRHHAWLWRLRLVAGKIRQRLAFRANRVRSLAYLMEVARFARDVGRAAFARSPSLWSGWKPGPWQWRRPRLWLRASAQPETLAGASISMAPFDFDHFTVYREVFAEKSYDLALVPFGPEIILDCGAHVGSFSCLAAVRFPGCPIRAFEPDSANRWFLHRNTRGLPAAVTVSPAAVSDHAGRARFSEGGHWARLHTAGVSLAGTREVPLVSLPDVLREHARNRRLLLKLDIEGAEATLLPLIAPLLPATTALFFETHGGTEVWHRCRAALEAEGFAVQLLRRRDYLGTVDAFIDAFALRTPPAE